MSTKIIRRHFDINSACTLNATSAGVLHEVDSHTHTFMEEPRTKLFTGRIMMNQMSSPGVYNDNNTSENNQQLNSRRNPFPFDT